MPKRAELIEVLGLPVTQGSKRAFAVRRKDGNGAWQFTGRAALVEDRKDDLKVWRSVLVDAARSALAGREPFTGPVALKVTFTLRRPRAHYGTGRNAALVRRGAPGYPAGRPDLSKLVRAVEDALKAAGVYGDDAQVVEAHVCKRYPVAVRDLDVLTVPGAVIRVWPL